MSLEDAKPVRDIDRFACKPEVIILTYADIAEGIRMMSGRYYSGLIPGLLKGSQQEKDFFFNKKLARDTALIAIHKMVSQPK